MKLDFLGKEVRVGDYIFYSTTGRYAESRLGRVTRMSEKSIWINVVKANRQRYGADDKEVIVQNSFVKIAEYEE